MTLLSDNASCLKRIAHARFLSDTRHCPMVTSVCRRTVPDSGLGPLRAVICERACNQCLEVQWCSCHVSGHVTSVLKCSGVVVMWAGMLTSGLKCSGVAVT